jgi:hypothetical protein
MIRHVGKNILDNFWRSSCCVSNFASEYYFDLKWTFTDISRIQRPETTIFSSTGVIRYTSSC